MWCSIFLEESQKRENIIFKKKPLWLSSKKMSKQPKGVSMRFYNEHPQAPQGSKKGVKRLVV
ncbi:hypothetical protein C6N29_07670 [Flavobacterium columnare]|nr:hypothetical protein C6N29_07670 [Flavobacterium columnare]